MTTDCEETGVEVTSSSGFILKRVFETVPSRLIGRPLGVRLYDDRLGILYRRRPLPGLATQAQGGINDARARGQVPPRHPLLKAKPIALQNLVYRDELCPREACCRCFEVAVSQAVGGRIQRTGSESSRAGRIRSPDHRQHLRTRFRTTGSQMPPGFGGIHLHPPMRVTFRSASGNRAAGHDANKLSPVFRRPVQVVDHSARGNRKGFDG